MRCCVQLIYMVKFSYKFGTSFLLLYFLCFTDYGIHNVNPGVSDDADNNSINTESISQLSDT